jgi:diguanylate cyclase (GGDEF)-like protein
MYLSIYSHTVNKLERELRQMAERDPLTGLYNRRKMMQLLSLAVDSEKNEKIAVAMLDADFFKKINDTYGHDAGDEVLKRLADILKNKDSGDGKFFICRWGGEEFFVLYKYEGTRESVIDEFEALRSTVEDSGVTYEDQKIRITVTIGLAFYHSGIQLNDLLKEADTLLYDGKASGRNCVSTNIAKLQTI